MNEIDSTNVYAAAEQAGRTASATPASQNDGPSLTATRDGMLASVTAATSPDGHLQPPGEAGADQQVTLDQLVDEPQSAAQQMYADGGHVLGDPAQYHSRLGETFDSLERTAREDGHQDDVDSLAEGRRVASELAHELQVPVRATTTLQGYLIAVQNAAYERTRRTNFKNPLQAVNWMVDMVSMLVLPGIVTAVIRGQWPKDEDDDGSTLDDWILKSGEDGLATLVGGIPGLSAAASELRGYDAKGVVADAWESAGRAITQARQGELDKPALKSAINVAAFATGIPASQINTTIDAIDQAQDGEPVSPWEYVNGPKKDKDQ